MEELVKQIEKALDSNLYYLALISTLVLPDIAGAISYSPKGSSSEEFYIKWFDKYVDDKALTGKESYLFRHKIVHQGTSIVHGSSSFKKIAFVYTKTTTERQIFLHNILDDLGGRGILYVDINIFCDSVIRGIRKWLHEVENTEQFQKNYSKFIKFHPNGSREYTHNIPVIASAPLDSYP
ncbi:MAG: hypothetical protein HEQ14_09745 [Aphanizomenon flos-aquae CP01]|jgi:hypothetical protein|nr:hypothetical protein [Aphanizomenon flos-aquae CP01]